jgi:hypothetical protein
MSEQPKMHDEVARIMGSLNTPDGDARATITAGVLQAQAIDRLADAVKNTNILLTQLLEAV